MIRAAAVLIVTASVVQAPGAQPGTTLDELLDRMGDYLVAYESQLSSVVAEEIFDQTIQARYGTRARHLESDVAFMRLPGGAEWLGFREVRRVNWKQVKTPGGSIADVLTSAAGDLTKALAIANASANHNLGLPRTINVPTAPLDIIHPRHRKAHKFDIRGDEKVDGTPTVVLGFVETARPSLVREPSGIDLVSSGRIWIEPANGRIRRIEWYYKQETRRPTASAPPRLRVDFEMHRDLGFMVPIRMDEVFSVPAGRGEGRATYRNFRRFGTSARIVPQ